ncbi:MAG: cobalamin B12-binding domain-containing protein, partial [Clostridia bacterium]
MTTLLIAINAKYTHTNLAVRYLQNALAQSGIPAHFSEYTINQSAREILTDLVRQQPERLLFSCYIWNIAQVQTVATEYRLLFPHAQILLGGPEVSFDAEQLLAQMPWANAIVCGEGELLLPQVL